MTKSDVFRRFDRLSVWPRIFLNALVTSTPFYFAAFLSSSVAEAYSSKFLTKLFIHIAIFGGLIILVTFFYRMLCFYYEAYKGEAEQEHQALFQAFTLCDRRVVKQHQIIKNSFSDPSQKLRNLIASPDRIQEIVDDAYATFEFIYGSQERSGERVDFEVTFMTRSFEDGEITIPCSAKRIERSFGPTCWRSLQREYRLRK